MDSTKSHVTEVNLEGGEVEVKEIIQDYVLICYDIPQKEKALRHRFLKLAHSLGAVMHTASVYLMPYSDEAFKMAEELAAVGEAVVWKSHQANLAQAAGITHDYAAHLQARCQLIEQRLVMAQEHLAAGRLKLAAKMGVKTNKLHKELCKIQETYGQKWLLARIIELSAGWEKTHGGQYGQQES